MRGLPASAASLLLAFADGTSGAGVNVYDALREADDASASKSASVVESLTQKGHSKFGAFRVPSEKCEALRTLVLRTIDESGDEPALDPATFGAIKAPHLRWDVKLRCDDVTRSVLNPVVERLIAELTPVLTARAELFELSCVVSAPGAKQQPLHSDTQASRGGDEVALVLTTFVALQDVTLAMGPTTFYSGMHAPCAARSTYFDFASSTEQKLEVLRSRAKQSMTLSQGEMVVMDSRLLHGGGANRSALRRALLCVSFVAAGLPLPRGSTHSLRDELKTRRLTLDAFPV